MAGGAVAGATAVLLAAWTPALPSLADRDPVASAAEAIVAQYERWRELAGQGGSLPQEELLARADRLTEETFTLDLLAESIVGDSWSSRAPHQRSRFVDALRRSLRDGLLGHLEEAGPRSALSLVGEEGSDSVATIRFAVTLGDRTGSLAVRARRMPDDGWGVIGATYEDASLVDRYRERVKKLLDDYSFAYMVARIGDAPYVVLEDFEAGPVGELPAGWSWRSADDGKNKPYRVREEEGNRYLEATDEGESVILAKDVTWDVNEYPYVSFRWRVHRIPEGGDERYDDRVDSGAGIYFVYRKVLGLIPESVKYVWSSTLPVGSAVQREGTGKPWMVVVGSGEEHLGEWRSYVFDLRDAYRKTFGGNPPDKPLGIAILSDANSTRSQAYADYDDLRALRTAEPGVTGGVEKRLRPKR